jgi:hypothetical protein
VRKLLLLAKRKLYGWLGWDELARLRAEMDIAKKTITELLSIKDYLEDIASAATHINEANIPVLPEPKPETVDFNGVETERLVEERGHLVAQLSAVRSEPTIHRREKMRRQKDATRLGLALAQLDAEIRRRKV